MSREVKFRVWNNGQFNYFTIGDTFSETSLTMYDYHCENGRNFERYTGISDKNGKEAYEGDLKRWKFDNHDWIFICYWSEIDCGFRWKLVKHNEKQDLTDDTQIHYDTEKDFYDYVIKSNQRDHGMDQWSEVIGNIHQDSNLLN